MTAAQQRETVVAKVKSREGKNQYTTDATKRTQVASGYSDCSSLQHWAYKQIGMEIGGYTGAQINNGEWVTQGGAYPNESLLLPGDELFFSSPDSSYSYKVGHVEMYVGNGELSGHGSGTGPTRKNMITYCKNRNSAGKNYIGTKRYIKASANEGKKYTVKYDANGGSGTMSNTTVTYGVTTNLRVNTFTRSGYRFTGWYAYRHSDSKWLYDLGNGSDGWYKEGSQPNNCKKYLYADKTGVAKTSSVDKDTVTMYAQWAGYKCTVKYDANEGSGTMAATTNTFGTASNLRKNTFTRSGYQFTGWHMYKQSDGTYRYVTADGKKRFYKKGSEPSGSKLALYKDEGSIQNLSAVNNDTVIMYAQWAGNKCTVKYDANEGSGTMAVTINTFGIASNLRKNTFTRSGYQFTGWHMYKQSDGTYRYVTAEGKKRFYKKGSEPSGSTLALYKDQGSIQNLSATNNDTVIMYAQWTGNKCTVKYDANGGSGTMAATTNTFGIASNLRKNTFTRSGYQFTGWHMYKQSDGTYRYVTAEGKKRFYKKGSEPSGSTLALYKDQGSIQNLSATNNDTVIMYAQWKKN